jgi:hypothetical protein
VCNSSCSPFFSTPFSPSPLSHPFSPPSYVYRAVVRIGIKLLINTIAVSHSSLDNRTPCVPAFPTKVLNNMYLSLLFFSFLSLPSTTTNFLSGHGHFLGHAVRAALNKFAC